MQYKIKCVVVKINIYTVLSYIEDNCTVLYFWFTHGQVCQTVFPAWALVNYYTTMETCLHTVIWSWKYFQSDPPLNRLLQYKVAIIVYLWRITLASPQRSLVSWNFKLLIFMQNQSMSSPMAWKNCLASKIMLKAYRNNLKYTWI